MTFSSLVGRPACHFECVYTTLELNHAAEALKTGNNHVGTRRIQCMGESQLTGFSFGSHHQLLMDC